MNTTVVSSQSNPLAYLKAIATLVGSIVTGLLGVYTGDTEIGKALTIVGIVATAIATWVVPNADVDPTLSDGVGEGQEGTVTTVAASGDPEPYNPFEGYSGGQTYGTQPPLSQPGSDAEGFGGDAPHPSDPIAGDPHRP